MTDLKLETGDLILFDHKNGYSFFGLMSYLIKYFTRSNYTHIGMILKDPTFINPTLKGHYLWESSWNARSARRKDKVGVQITPLHEILEEYKKKGGNVFVRRLKR